jgi:hypothetical protein
MTEPRFDYEKSTWAGGDAEQARRWYEECPENVRARLAQTNAGSPGAIPIGREMTMTIGFAQEWLVARPAESGARSKLPGLADILVAYLQSEELLRALAFVHRRSEKLLSLSRSTKV